MRIGPLIGCLAFLLLLFTAPAWAEETGSYKFGRWLNETAALIAGGTADIARGMTSDDEPARRAAPSEPETITQKILRTAGVPEHCVRLDIEGMSDECLEFFQIYLAEVEKDLAALQGDVAAELGRRGR